MLFASRFGAGGLQVPMGSASYAHYHIQALKTQINI